MTHLAGWKQIADAVGRSVRACQRWAERTDALRLPVYRYCGEVRVDVVELARWQRAMRQREMGRAA